MNKERLIKRLLIFLLLSLALNLGFVGSYIYSRINTTNSENKNTELQSTKFSGRYFKDALGLSSSQMDDFKTINSAFRQKARNIYKKLNLAKKNMLTEMQKTNTKQGKLDSLSAEIGVLHKELKEATTTYYLEIKTICTPEQEQELNRIFESFFVGDSIPSPGNGQGKRYRHGQQGRNRNKN